MLNRFIEEVVSQYLATFRVVLLVGARQAGKSTLVKEIAKDRGLTYRTLDNATELSRASTDPQGYIRNLDKPVVIDEVQRLPELLLPIKLDVDEHSNKGRYFLTGSANVLQLPKVADSLAGRMGILQMFPLSQSEMEGTESNFVNKVFTDEFTYASYEAISRDEIIQRIKQGGYPENIGLDSNQRQLWFDSYVNTMIQRDIRDISNIEGLTDVPRLLTLLATRTSVIT